MSDGSTESRQNDLEVRPAQAADDSIRTETDTALNNAITQAAQRDAADLVARNEAYIRHATEMALLNAKARGDQTRFDALEPAEESRVLRARLLKERKAASNATFGLTVASVLLVIGFIAGGIYFFSSQNSSGTSASTGVTPGILASTTLPTKSSDVSAPERTPTTIHVNSASDGAEASGQIGIPESAAPPISNALGNSDVGDPTHMSPPQGSTNLSGAALHSGGVRPVKGSNLNSGGVMALPESDSGIGTGTNSAHP
ncbi:MAG: hypothetical protein JWN14_3044 [Chthonomonadales bacterium]|nr:hypothetical protein [Chthonomonadales bacterium]